MAAEGKNEVARSLLDLQPTAVLELYKLYPDTVDSPSVFLSFHGGSVFGGNITWQGIQYIPIPVESEGFGVFGDGTLPRPKIKVSNNEKIVTYFLGKYKDFKNAKVYRKKVFVKHLDDVNFDGNNPFGLANSDAEISEEKYLIGQKVQENNSYVEFELNLPLDLDNFDVNHRTVNAKYCYWQYRGLGCRYNGLPIEKDDGSPFVNVDGQRVGPTQNIEDTLDQSFFRPDYTYSVGDIVYTENKNVILNTLDGNRVYHKTWYVCVSGHQGEHPEDNPSYWQKDGCSKKIEACQKRFSSDSLKRVVVGDVDASFDYLHLPKDQAASLLTTDPDVTGVFDGDEWTVSLWIRGEKQHNIEGTERWRHPTVFGTKALPREPDPIYSTPTYLIKPNEDDSRWTTKEIKANLFFDPKLSDRNIGENLSFASIYADGVGSKKHPILQPVASTTEFKSIFIQKYNEGGTAYIKILVNPYKNEYGTFVENNPTRLQTVNNDAGIDFFALFGESDNPQYPELSFGGDIAQACLWSKKLSNDQITWLATANMVSDSQEKLTDNGIEKFADTYSDYAPLRYSEATGYLATLTGSDSSLVCWYDMNTGEVSSKFVVEDESVNANHLTGFGSTGEFSTRTIEYTRGRIEDFILNQNSDYRLPFGGFPGTDGFSFKAVGSENI